ncbi:MAG: hypothetical protein KF864_01765 [Phycisphaeraceae bacterium]|nr:hypothetical protein [Phycisphaeraceae bacterium]
MNHGIRTSRPVWLALNVVLLLALVWAVSVPDAWAQNSGSRVSRARGDYTMVSGKMGTGTGELVYVLDSSNQQVVALRWDSSRKRFNGVGHRDLSADAVMAPGR